ncbi:mucin-associated surface protein [Paenarthrobacter sp. DKR-5]|uniref:mucin-associated surface protein n=1 Tax=Paenarthrobacter sp. DKR-5 TaxID=2835535 RepID=UPI001BDBF196|nr:mucin-associated surface protein [Paenarthrobacter sp. DKR-5]MBT1002828.1 mucin-associated surface protein [Paenarthrobacter sp. DKR-5]
MSRLSMTRGTGVLAAVLAAGALLASCSAPADLDAAAASQLQSRVLAVSKDAAGKNYAGALADLDQLGRDLDAAAAAGKLTPARREQISSAMALVRADLSAARTAASASPSPSTAPTPTPTPAPAVAPAVTPTAAPAPLPPAPAKGRSHSKGKGKKDH